MTTPPSPSPQIDPVPKDTDSLFRFLSELLLEGKITSFVYATVLHTLMTLVKYATELRRHAVLLRTERDTAVKDAQVYKDRLAVVTAELAKLRTFARERLAFASDADLDVALSQGGDRIAKSLRELAEQRAASRKKLGDTLLGIEQHEEAQPIRECLTKAIDLLKDAHDRANLIGTTWTESGRALDWADSFQTKVKSLLGEISLLDAGEPTKQELATPPRLVPMTDETKEAAYEAYRNCKGDHCTSLDAALEAFLSASKIQVLTPDQAEVVELRAALAKADEQVKIAQRERDESRARASECFEALDSLSEVVSSEIEPHVKNIADRLIELYDRRTQESGSRS